MWWSWLRWQAPRDHLLWVAPYDSAGLNALTRCQCRAVPDVGALSHLHSTVDLYIKPNLGSLGQVDPASDTVAGAVERIVTAKERDAGENLLFNVHEVSIAKLNCY